MSDLIPNRGKSETDVVKSAAAGRLGCTSTHKGFTAAWKSLEAALTSGNATVLAGRPVRFAFVSYGAGLPSRFALHEDDLPLLAQEAGIVEAAPPGWMSRDRFAEAIGCYPLHPKFKRLWDSLKATYEADGIVRDETGRVVRMRAYRLGARTILCMDVSEGPWFDREAGLTERLKVPDYPEWTSDWLSRNDVGRALDCTPTTSFFLALWEEIQSIAKGSGSGELRGRSVKAKLLARKVKVTTYLHRDSVAAFGAVHAEIKAARKEAFRAPRRESLRLAHRIWSVRTGRNKGERPPAFAIGRTAFAEKMEEARKGAGLSPRIAGGHAEVREIVAGRWKSLAGRVLGTGLWRHQKEAIRAFASHFGTFESNPQGICIIPPGGGKTEIFSNLLDAAMRDDGRGTPNSIVLVPTQQMVEQTLTRIRTGFPALSPGAVSSFHGGDVRPLTVMTYSGFVWAVEEGMLAPQDVDLLVLDECHRALSELRQDIFGRFVGNTLVAAFSATPAFDTEKNVYALLGSANTLIDIPLGRLIDDRILAPVANYVVCVPLVGTLPKGAKARAELVREATVAAALYVHLNYGEGIPGPPLAQRRFLGFTKGRAHNAVAVRGFSGIKRDVLELSGRDSLARQVGALAALQRGEIDGIVNARLLVEGTDLPKVGVVYNIAHTNSLVVEVQRSGRALRLDADIPVDDPRQTALIFDFYVEHEGKILGRPRFFFETVGGEIPVKLVKGPAYHTGLPTCEVLERPADPPIEKAVDIDADEQVATFGSDLKSVHHLIAKRDEVGNYRSEEWLPRTHVLAALRVSYKHACFKAAWASLVEAREGDVAVVDGVAYRFASRRETSGEVLCLHSADIEAFAELAGIELRLPNADASRLGKMDIVRRFNTHHRKSPFARLWDEIVDAHRTGPPYVVRGQALDLRMVKGKIRTYLTVSDRELPWIREACGLGQAEAISDEWIGGTDLRERIAASKSPKRLLDVWNLIRAAVDAGRDRIVIGKTVIEVGRVVRRNRLVAAIRASSVDALLSVLGPDQPSVPVKAAGWLSRNDLSSVLKLAPESKFLKRLYGELIPGSLVEGSVWLGTDEIKVSLMRCASRWKQCIHVDGVPALRRHLGIPEDSDANWIPKVRAFAMLGNKPARALAKAWDGMKRLAESGDPVVLGGVPVRFELRKVRPTSVFHIHVDDIPVLADSVGLEWPIVPILRQPEGEGRWSAKRRTAKVLGVKAGSRAFKNLWKEVSASIDRDGAVRGVPIKVETMDRKGKRKIFVHESSLPDLGKLLSPE